MSSSSMGPASPLDAQVMENMTKAREYAEQLQGLLQDTPEARLNVEQILHSISRAMHALHKVSAAGTCEGSDVQSEVSCGKRKAADGGAPERRPNSRRRTQQSSGLTKILKNLDDGQAWRKYGQKEIQNSTYPKAYFRCTHKYDQQCVAQRQVQRCDEDPASYRITYIGDHTCRDPAATDVAQHVLHQAVDDDDGLHAGSRLISFAPADAATASTTTTAPQLLQQPLKVEVGGVDQEEVLSSLTPGNSAARCGIGCGCAAAGLEQGDVTSSLHCSYGAGAIGAAADMEFLRDDYGMFDLEDLLRF
ncbi:hypothetical protein GUJ93_ZPchr0010g10945 [Zizania palustris]|uniref:WRKY domain-containing protein n=1 Tax=Zizania palustris TaxID=103762 RepID=A0A8J6BH55_ZIZPA|nr:hypothetical protein GUJ93_ZPchr0010g10945 [Zizania palustris]